MAAIMVIPVNNDLYEYAESVKTRLVASGKYAVVDVSDKLFKEKARDAQLAQYNFICQVGARERDNDEVTVRVRDEGKERGTMSVELFLEELEDRETDG